MTTGIEEIRVPIGGRFKKTYDFLDGTGNAEDFVGRTATLFIKNISEDYIDDTAIECIDCVTVAPLDMDGNAFTNRLEIDISPEYTAQLKLPYTEKDGYKDSGRYAIATVKFDNEEVALNLIIRPFKTA